MLEWLDRDSLRNILVSTGSLRDAARLAETDRYFSALLKDRDFLDSLANAFHIPTGMENIREMITYSEKSVYHRLLDAVNRENLSLVKFLIEEGDAQEGLYQAIEDAAKVGSSKIFNYLVAFLSAEELENYLLFPFYHAFTNGHVNIIKIIDEKIDINKWSNRLLTGRYTDSIPVINYLIEKGYVKSMKLHFNAAKYGHYEMLSELIPQLSKEELEMSQLYAIEGNRVDTLYLIRKSADDLEFSIDCLEAAAKTGNLGVFRMIFKTMDIQTIREEVLSYRSTVEEIGATPNEEIFNTIFDIFDDEYDELKPVMAYTAIRTAKNFNNAAKSFEYVKPYLETWGIDDDDLIYAIVEKDNTDDRVLAMVIHYVKPDLALELIKPALTKGKMGKYQILFARTEKTVETYNRVLEYAARAGNFEVMNEMLSLGANDFFRPFVESKNLDVAIFLESVATAGVNHGSSLPTTYYRELVLRTVSSGGDDDNLAIVKYYYEKSGIAPENLEDIKMSAPTKKFIASVS
jgi:hypothetical protein